MSAPETIPPKKFGVFASLFFAFFPAVALAFATAFLVEAALALLPGEIKQATIIDRHTRVTLRSNNDNPKTVYSLSLEFVDGTRKQVGCPGSIHDTWPVGMIVEATVFPSLDHKVISLTWQPDEQQRTAGLLPVTFSRSTAWWIALPSSLALLLFTFYSVKEYFFSRKFTGSRPVLVILFLLAILMGFGIVTAW
jgi:hypothetical protein